MHVEVFFDYLCPWSHLSQARVDGLVRRHGIEVTWTPFELHPEIPPGGTDRRWGKSGTGSLLRPLAEAAGLPLERRSKVVSTRRALALSAWAMDQPAWPDLHRRLFAAYWGEDADLEDPLVLSGLATEAGVVGATGAIDEGSGLDAVVAAKERALDLGIGGTPGWVFDGGQAFTGLHDDAVLDRIINRA